MSKYKTALITFMAALTAASPAYSADLDIESISEAAKRTGDLSRQMLHTVFGEVVNNPFSPSGDGLLNNVFFTVNEVIAILALVYMGIITLKKFHQAGQLGQFVEGDSNNAFKIVKTTFGWLMLVPTVVGWSVAQLLFLWCGSIIGVGSANVIADKTASELASGKAVYITPVMPEMASVAKGMFEMNLCALGVNQGLAQMEASGQHYEADSLMKYNTGSSSYSISVDNGSAVCGTVKLPQKPTGWSSVFSSGYADAVYTTQQQATDTLWSKMKSTAEQFNSAYMSRLRAGDGELPDVETAIQTAARDYQQKVQQAADNAAGSNDMLQKMETDIKDKGWLYLGIYYHTLATANTELKDVANLKPVISGMSGDGDVGSTDYYKGLFQAYHSQLKNSTYTPPLGTADNALAQNIDNKGIEEAAKTGDAGSLITKIFNFNVTAWLATRNYGSGDGYSDVTNPLLKMKAIGDYTMFTAESGLAAWGAVNVAMAVAEGNNAAGLGASALNFFSGGKDIIKGIIKTVAPMIYMILVALFCIGLTLSIWLPFVPFIFWFVAMADWLVTLMTGIVASSLWAATHINIGQSNEDRSTYGYIFLIDVMIRPLLMVMGFIFASLAVVALGTALNYIFATAMENVQADSTTGLWSMIGILFVYARICTGMVARVFALPARMPNYVISWIGNKQNDSILGDMQNHVHDLFAAFGRGAKTTGKVPGGPKNFNPTNAVDKTKDGIAGG
ncbi:DotA/TraY family protein [Pantoea sp. PNA 03-3]|uniref:DotA/TraY family protein n=1 Tax=Pantoea sp. PNA 03-3 TaxID=2135460 RepID=UPI000D75DCAA|nr:DotA/TraY family protein [Pantoea sp. PNA 03-3]PXV70943.1 conjugal transfer/type IV secretion protein DotA/TraY [Pantoea sp. PNA 03-3]